jgi:hypothetical protein
LSSSRDQKSSGGRRPFDKMATLLAHLGPPEHRHHTSSVVNVGVNSFTLIQQDSFKNYT